ncbi:hypothetical protein ASF65_20500 [Aureimonas sp. Leaf324]|nr:hypothetical protein ASF65_20500 [Aureimonas sp. Leaf324]
MTAKTETSASVKKAASAGGSRPLAAHRRRRSMLSGERGRDPTRRLGVAGAIGSAFRASIASARLCASASSRDPAACARQRADASFGRSLRLDRSIAAAMD